MPEKSTFFCFGPPKSGTTLLQRCLDLHPMISCPSEHHFDFLHERFGSLFQEYNRGLDVTDLRTGGQGASHVLQSTVTKIFRAAIHEILCQSAKDKYGSYDKWILMLADQFNLSADHYRLAFESDPNAMRIKYEDLVSNKAQVLQKLFRFLDAPWNDVLLRNIVEATDFNVMRAKARRPHFFRAASESPTEESVSIELQKQVHAMTEDSLTYLEY